MLRRLLTRLANSRALIGLRRPSYFEDGILSFHNCAFLRSERFQRAYRLGKETGSWGGQDIRWRAHVACWAADLAQHLEGDFVECGVNRGGLSRAVIDYLGFERLPKMFYLVDTYQGLVPQQITAEERQRGIGSYDYADCYGDVVRTFAPFCNVKVVRGAVPEVLSQVPAQKLAYLSIDMNCVVPEIAAIEHFWPMLSPGAIVLLDDYAWKHHVGQQVAFDRFAVGNGAGILTLPTGQGLLIKPR